MYCFHLPQAQEEQLQVPMELPIIINKLEEAFKKKTFSNKINLVNKKN